MSGRKPFGSILASLSRRTWLIPLALVIVAGAAALRVTGVIGPRDAVWARMQDKGVWRVAMDPSFPPLEFVDGQNGAPQGLDVDLAVALAARMNVKAEIVAVGFDELIDAVAAHRVDAAISGLPVVEHRTREVAFSRPYLEAGTVIASPIAARLDAAEALAGKRLAVEWGSEGDAQARTLARTLTPAPTVIPRESADLAMATVLSGEADAALVDAISLALFDRERQALAQGTAPVASEPYVVMMPADAPVLQESVDRALGDMDREGQLDALRTRWLGR